MDLKNITPVSDWIEYELVTRPPQKIKVKIEHIPGASVFDYIDSDGTPQLKGSEIVFQLVLDAIKEWDLTLDGKPLAVDQETKEKFRKELSVIFDIKVKVEPEEGKKPRVYTLTSALFEYARNQENFLKN